VRDDLQHVLGLAIAFVVRAPGSAHAAKVEAEGRRPRLDEDPREGRDHFVVHRAPEERMGMRDDRDRARRLGDGGDDLDLAGRAVEERAGGRRGH